MLASGGENFGLVAAEAAAVGTPVIVSDRTGIAASFRDGEALVVPYDKDATVAAVARVLEDVVWSHRGLRVAPKSVNQKRYVDSVRSKTITFGIGPAGTGKTFLAVAMAAAALSRGCSTAPVTAI